MKIAVLTEIINRKSGARAPLEIAKASKEQGNDVTIFAFKHDLEKEALKELRELEIEVSLIQTKRFFVPFVLAKKLRGSFDIISYHAKVLFFIGARLSGLPMIRTYHGTQLDPIIDKQFPNEPTILIKALNWIANKYVHFAESLLLHNSDKILAISKYAQDEVKRLYKFPAEYIYYGATPANFKYRRRKRKKETVIISVSRVIPYKGFHLLIKIFNRLHKKNPAARLEIIGSTPDKKYLAHLKKISGKNVDFFLNIPDEELVKHYQGADIYATFDRYMFFGMPLLEAGFLGLPAVVIAKCAAPEIIKHGQTGFLAKNEKEFAVYLEKLIKNPGLRDRMGQEARQQMKKFSWKTFGKQYTKWFNEAIERSKEKALLRKKKRQKLALFGGILLLGILLRLAFINSHTFWFDEAFSYFVADRPFSSLLHIAATDSQPPLYYLFLKFWLKISREVWFLRFLSLIFGVAAIPLFYKIAKKLTDVKTAFLASSILAISPLHLYFSTETRMYSLFVFFTLLLFWLFLKVLETKNKSYLSLLGLVAILATHIHYYSFFVIFTLNLAFFAQINYRGLRALGILALRARQVCSLVENGFHPWAKSPRFYADRIKKAGNLLFPWIVSQLFIILGFLPWFWLMRQYPHPDCWCFPPEIGLPAAFTSFAVGGMGVVTLKDIVFSGPRLPLTIFTILSALMFIAFLLGLWTLQKDSAKNRFLLIFFFTPILMVTIISFFYPLFSPRALIIVSPFYYLFAAVGILSFKNQLAQKLLIKVLFILIFITLAFQFFNPFFYGPPIEKAANFVAQKRQDDEVIIHLSPMTFYSFQYFHRFLYPEFLMLPSSTSSHIFEIGNYQKSIKELAPSYSKIWLVNFAPWVKTQKIEEVKEALAKDFVLKQKVKYNNVEVYYFVSR